MGVARYRITVIGVQMKEGEGGQRLKVVKGATLKFECIDDVHCHYCLAVAVVYVCLRHHETGGRRKGEEEGREVSTTLEQERR